MKKYLMNQSSKIITSIYPDINKNKLSEIIYGLESIYLSFTKTIVIILISVILNIFKETIMLLIFFNILRMFAFGIHAKKSWQCWISSIFLFIVIPYYFLNTNYNYIFYYSIMFISILFFILYAPADTVKRPLIKKNRRIKFKILTLLVSMIYIYIFVTNSNILLRNTIVFSMLIESVLIHPFTYKVFKLPYKNYERYVFSK